MDEQQAITRLKRGDVSGLETLVRNYEVKAIYVAFLILQDRQSAEDVVQDSFLRVIEKIDQFDDHRPFEPWFIRSVVNNALDVSRSRGRQVSFEEGMNAETQKQLKWLMDDLPRQHELLETRELRESIRLALKALHPNHRAAIVLRYFMDMSEAEISDALRRPGSTIKWWLHEAKRTLKTILSPRIQTSGNDDLEE
jgi:RNA polymerase sigma-70 factor (ECF subfamily)